MDTTNKHKPNQNHPKDKAQDEATSPVNLRSGDKLRENPSNDEETIEQNSKKVDTEKTEQSPLSRKHDDERNRQQPIENGVEQRNTPFLLTGIYRAAFRFALMT